MFLARIGLSVLRLPVLARVLETCARLFRRHPRACVPSEDIAWAVSAVARRIPRGCGCLPMSLAAFVLLRSRGSPVELRLGVLREGACGLRAHAWVQNGPDVVFSAGDAGRYHPLPTFL